MKLPSYGPEPYASANSAIPAYIQLCSLAEQAAQKHLQFLRLLYIIAKATVNVNDFIKEVFILFLPVFLALAHLPFLLGTLLPLFSFRCALRLQSPANSILLPGAIGVKGLEFPAPLP